MSQPCPCGSAVEHGLCCHPHVSDEKIASDPEHLMRSRYCAFVMQDADYLIRAWHPSCGAATLRAELMAEFTYTEWLGLTVLEHCQQDADGIGFISFATRFTEDGKVGAIIECLRFLKENGQWYYIDGTHPQFSRSDPRSCGSGRKSKKCYGR